MTENHSIIGGQLVVSDKKQQHLIKGFCFEASEDLLEEKCQANILCTLSLWTCSAGNDNEYQIKFHCKYNLCCKSCSFKYFFLQIINGFLLKPTDLSTKCMANYNDWNEKLNFD